MNHQTAEIQESRVSVLEADPMADLLAKPIDSVTAKADKAAETIEALTIKITELEERLRGEAGYRGGIFRFSAHD